MGLCRGKHIYAIPDLSWQRDLNPTEAVRVPTGKRNHQLLQRPLVSFHRWQLDDIKHRFLQLLLHPCLSVSSCSLGKHWSNFDELKVHTTLNLAKMPRFPSLLWGIHQTDGNLFKIQQLFHLVKFNKWVTERLCRVLLVVSDLMELPV